LGARIPQAKPWPVGFEEGIREAAKQGGFDPSRESLNPLSMNESPFPGGLRFWFMPVLAASVMLAASAPAGAHPNHSPPAPADYRLDRAGEDYRPPEVDDAGFYWWRGNLHTHTLWSDGDAYPEVIVDWYKRNGYHFLALSDHNVLSVGDRWINPATHRHAQRAGGMEGFELYLERFGEDWVETREENGGLMVRLKPLNEFRFLFEEPGRFLMMQAEEITAFIHVNATNLLEFIPPPRTETARETIEASVAAVMEQRERTGQLMFPHLNHPNWRWRVTAEDMAPVEDLRFFEVYNGHRNSRNYGDETHKSLERMWDIVLTLRLGELGLGPVYGLGVDDSHNYENSESDVSRPGRGWVMVRSKFLTPDHLIRALEAGDFYSSSGVKLRRIRAEENLLAIEIEPEEGVGYTTEFIGTRRGYDASSELLQDEEGNSVTRRYSEEIGVVLATVEGLSPSYTFDGNELYVRARVTSSRDKEDYYQPGEKEKAWVQPVVVRSR
jgi:hypothetical protein